jgi:hypothetical protein
MTSNATCRTANPKGKPLFEDDNSWKKAMGSKNSTMARFLPPSRK